MHCVPLIPDLSAPTRDVLEREIEVIEELLELEPESKCEWMKEHRAQSTE